METRTPDSASPTPVPLDRRPAMTIEEAGELIGVSGRFLRGFVEDGSLAHVPLGTRVKLIRREALDKFLADNERFASG